MRRAIWLGLSCLCYLSIVYCDEAQKRSLLLLKNAIDPQGSVLGTWGESTEPCGGSPTWTGVACADGLVTSIGLSGLGLSGNLPDNRELYSALYSVTELDLSNNKLYGNIPKALEYLGSKISTIRLNTNYFAGEIPAWQGMAGLNALYLNNNQLTGALPAVWNPPATELTDLPALTTLDVSANPGLNVGMVAWTKVAVNCNSTASAACGAAQALPSDSPAPSSSSPSRQALCSCRISLDEPACVEALATCSTPLCLALQAKDAATYQPQLDAYCEIVTASGATGGGSSNSTATPEACICTTAGMQDNRCQQAFSGSNCNSQDNGLPCKAYWESRDNPAAPGMAELSRYFLGRCFQAMSASSDSSLCACAKSVSSAECARARLSQCARVGSNLCVPAMQVFMGNADAVRQLGQALKNCTVTDPVDAGVRLTLALQGMAYKDYDSQFRDKVVSSVSTVSSVPTSNITTLSVIPLLSTSGGRRLHQGGDGVEVILFLETADTAGVKQKLDQGNTNGQLKSTLNSNGINFNLASVTTTAKQATSPTTSPLPSSRSPSPLPGPGAVGSGPQQEKKDKGVSVGIIVAAVAGAALLTGLVLAAVYIQRRRKHDRLSPMPSEEHLADHHKESQATKPSRIVTATDYPLHDSDEVGAYGKKAAWREEEDDKVGQWRHDQSNSVVEDVFLHRSVSDKTAVTQVTESDKFHVNSGLPPTASRIRQLQQMGSGGPSMMAPPFNQVPTTYNNPAALAAAQQYRQMAGPRPPSAERPNSASDRAQQQEERARFWAQFQQNWQQMKGMSKRTDGEPGSPSSGTNWTETEVMTPMQSRRQGY